MATKFQGLPSKETQIITPVFRLSFPHVWEKHRNEMAKRDQYDIVMLFDKKAVGELQAMYDLMKKVANHRFGVGAKGLKNPFKDGDTSVNTAQELIKEKNPSYAGQMVLSSWSKNQPGIINAKNQIILDHDEIYGGCYARAQLNCYAYEAAGNRGVSFGLLHIQKIKDGDPFGVRTRVEDAFAPVVEETSLAEESPANDSMFS